MKRHWNWLNYFSFIFCLLSIKPIFYVFIRFRFYFWFQKKSFYMRKGDAEEIVKQNSNQIWLEQIDSSEYDRKEKWNSFHFVSIFFILSLGFGRVDSFPIWKYNRSSEMKREMPCNWISCFAWHFLRFEMKKKMKQIDCYFALGSTFRQAKSRRCLDKSQNGT